MKKQTDLSVNKGINFVKFVKSQERNSKSRFGLNKHIHESEKENGKQKGNGKVI